MYVDSCFAPILTSMLENSLTLGSVFLCRYERASWRHPDIYMGCSFIEYHLNFLPRYPQDNLVGAHNHLAQDLLDLRSAMRGTVPRQGQRGSIQGEFPCLSCSKRRIAPDTEKHARFLWMTGSLGVLVSAMTWMVIMSILQHWIHESMLSRLAPWPHLRMEGISDVHCRPGYKYDEPTSRLLTEIRPYSMPLNCVLT